VTDGGGRRAVMMDGGDELWSTEGADGSADEMGRWATRRALRHTEETGGCGRRTRSCGYGQTEGGRMWLAAGGNRRMWPADIGCYDGWRAGGCGWLSPPHYIFGSFGHRWVDENGNWRKLADVAGG
jgi:hypothetical protein